jgi:hypothetical protein
LVFTQASVSWLLGRLEALPSTLGLVCLHSPDPGKYSFRQRYATSLLGQDFNSRKGAFIRLKAYRESGRCMLWREAGEFDVRLWHLADTSALRPNVRYRW